MGLKKHIKSYLKLTRFERNAMLIIICFILILALTNYMLPLVSKKPKVDFSDFETEVSKLYQKTEAYQKENQGKDKIVEQVKLFKFDPNTTSADSLKKLGIPEYVVANIVKYRNKGGRYYSSKDFSKVYGLNSLMFQKLEPFINISGKVSQPIETDSTQFFEFNFDLNAVCEEDLVKIPGIGKAYAKWIVQKRTQLGGFCKKEQLLEVYNFDSTLYKKVEKHITVKPVKLIQIPINTASYMELIRHPYISKELTKNIIEYKSVIGAYKSIQDLKTYKLIIDDDSFTRLEPYLKLWK